MDLPEMAASGQPFTFNGEEWRVSPWTLRQHADYLVWLRSEYVRTVAACAEHLPKAEAEAVIRDAINRAGTLELVLPEEDGEGAEEPVRPRTPELASIERSFAGILKRTSLYLARAHPGLTEERIASLANNYAWSAAFWQAVKALNREGSDDPKDGSK